VTKLPHKLEALSLLGKAVAVGIGGKEFPLSAGYFLAADPAGGLLVIAHDRAAVAPKARPNAAAVRAAQETRAKFAGQLDGREWSIQGFPSTWSLVGPAGTIVYRSDKTNGGGTGKSEDFIHEFSPGAKAYRSGDFLAIVGQNIRVDASGVRN